MTDSTPDWARPLVHFEITTANPEAMRTFYATMFNWNINEGAVMPMPAGIGGPLPGPGGTLRQSSRPGISLYFQVRHIDESIARTEELGGKVLSQPKLQPTGQTTASILDPDGNRIVLVQQ